MRRSRILSYGAATVLAAAAMSAGCIVGCSGDNSGTSQDGGSTDGSKGDATKPGNDASEDGAPIDDSSPGSTTGDAPSDTGATADGGGGDASDAGSEAAVDAGGDAAPEGGSTDDAGTGAGSDAGTDAGDAGASDASEAGTTPEAGSPDAGPDAEAGPPVSFSNPVQIRGFAFNGHTVATTATVAGDAAATIALTAMDGAGNGNVFPTQAVAAAGGYATTGIPNDAFFPGDGVHIPPVQLAWNDSVDALESILVSGTAGTQYQFNIPSGQYTKLQIYATGGNGGSTLNYALIYAGGTVALGSVAIPDWCSSPTASNTHKLVSTYRYTATTSKMFPGANCSIFAIDLSPDPTKTLTQMAFTDTGASNVNLVFFGATAW